MSTYGKRPNAQHLKHHEHHVHHREGLLHRGIREADTGFAETTGRPEHRKRHDPPVHHEDGRLTYAERQRLPARDFALPKERKYPIENASHARNALARVRANGTPEEQHQVCRAVHKRYPSIHETHCRNRVHHHAR